MADYVTDKEIKNQVISDLKAIADYYGGWDALRKAIDQIEHNENEDAYEKYTSGGSDAWSGGFAKNH